MTKNICFQIYSHLIVLVSLLIATACTTVPKHNHSSGVIQSVSDDGTAKVCLSKLRLKDGQRVDIFESKCERSWYETRWAVKPAVQCNDLKKGEATILATGDLHNATVKLISGDSLKAGQWIRSQSLEDI